MSESELWNVIGSHGTRGLLITFLGEFVLPATLTHDQPGVWTQTLVEALDRVDVQEKAARQMVARLHDNGWLSRESIGRQTRWSLTPWAQALLTDGAQRIYRFGRERPPWSGTWLVLLASLPETKRSLRYRLTSQLHWAGFGSLGQGVWISPRPDREVEIEALLTDLRLTSATLFRAELTELGDPKAVAAEAWDLPSLAKAYDQFSELTGTEWDDPLAELMQLVHRWRYFPTIDPDLPSQLLPDDFPKDRAVARFAAHRAELLDPAWQSWNDLEISFGQPRHQKAV